MAGKAGDTECGEGQHRSSVQAGLAEAARQTPPKAAHAQAALWARGGSKKRGSATARNASDVLVTGIAYLILS